MSLYSLATFLYGVRSTSGILEDILGIQLKILLEGVFFIKISISDLKVRKAAASGRRGPSYEPVEPIQLFYLCCIHI